MQKRPFPTKLQTLAHGGLLLLGLITAATACGASTSVQVTPAQRPLPPQLGPVSLVMPGQTFKARTLGSIRVSGAFGAGFLDNLYRDFVAAARRLGANAVIVDQVQAMIPSSEDVREVPCNDFITEALLNAWDPQRRDNPPICHVSGGTYDAGYRVIMEGRALRLQEEDR